MSRNTGRVRRRWHGPTNQEGLGRDSRAQLSFRDLKFPKNRFSQPRVVSAGDGADTQDRAGAGRDSGAPRVPRLGRGAHSRDAGLLLLIYYSQS